MNRNNPNKEAIRLSNGTILDSFIIKLLEQRSILGEKAIRSFLEPKLSDLPDPFLMNGMDIAVKIVEKAIFEKKSILIWGDYDVDGTTATALLLKFFKMLGCAADYYIPNRLTEGYGLQEDGLKEISKNTNPGGTVLVTVDNGISAHKAVKFAKTLGYKIIITDHHAPPTSPVPADAILNPKQENCTFPAKNLAGVGVAFYLAMGLRSHLAKNEFFKNKQNVPNLKLLLDLVAVGTVADMVPLHGINRILVRAGMETMAKQSNEGLTALCRASHLDPCFIRSEDISFQIAPKINAAGRLGNANKAIRLFLSKTDKEGQGIAVDLVENNIIRKNITISNLDDAIRETKYSNSLQEYSVIVSGEFHIGVAGIVASNLVEKYKKPSIVLCKFSDGIYKGSARSIPGINIFSALGKCEELLIGFGGHKMAGGLSIKKRNINMFKELFDNEICRQSGGQLKEIEKKVDANIEIIELFKNSTLRQLHLFEPFGQGNPQPVFRDTTANVHELSPVGKDKSHLRMCFYGKDKKNNNKITGIAFGLGAIADDCRNNKYKEILYTPSINFFRGRRSWQVRVTDIVFPDA